MIKIRIKNFDNEIDVQFPISKNGLYAKLAEIHAIEGRDAPQSAFVTDVYWPEELSRLKDRYVNLDELNYLARRMERASMLSSPASKKEVTQMSKTYWNEHGAHQQDAAHLADLIPTVGFTGNGYLDCYIGMSRLYYDLYNNGGGNVADGCHNDAVKKVKRVIREFSVDKFLCDEEYAESMMDKAVVIASTHDDDYCKYTVKIRDDTKEYWLGASNDDPLNTLFVNFGDPLERDEYLAQRCHGYKAWVLLEEGEDM